jgi:hypothetical protein
LALLLPSLRDAVEGVLTSPPRPSQAPSFSIDGKDAALELRSAIVDRRGS